MIGDDPSATVVITDNGSEVFRDNCFDSEIAEFTFARRPFTAAECLNVNGMTFTFGGDTEWARVLDGEAHDGDAALRSGAISDNQKVVLETKVSGAGTISFEFSGRYPEKSANLVELLRYL